MGRQHSEEEQRVKINIERKRLLYTEDDCFKNYKTTAAEMAVELNIHLKDPASTKTVQHELHKSNIHSRAATAKRLNTESNAQMCKRWSHDHKSWTSDKRKRARDMVR
jgi:hypothetical protein